MAGRRPAWCAAAMEGLFGAGAAVVAAIVSSSRAAPAVQRDAMQRVIRGGVRLGAALDQIALVLDQSLRGESGSATLPGAARRRRRAARGCRVQGGVPGCGSRSQCATPGGAARCAGWARRTRLLAVGWRSCVPLLWLPEVIPAQCTGAGAPSVWALEDAMEFQSVAVELRAAAAGGAQRSPCASPLPHLHNRVTPRQRRLGRPGRPSAQRRP